MDRRGFYLMVFLFLFAFDQWCDRGYSWQPASARISLWMGDFLFLLGDANIEKSNSEMRL